MNQLPTYRISRTSPTQQALQLCVAVLTLLFATGCGGGGGSSAPPASTTPAASSNAQLSGLVVSDGSIAFDPAQTLYNLNVGFMVASLQITPTLANANATVTVDGQSVASGAPASVSLVGGANNIDVVITAEDGTSTLTYTLAVDRATSASSNAQLSGLTLSSGSIAFDPATTLYNLTVSFMVTSLQITPTVANSNATITVAGQSVASGATVSVSLVEGVNNIDVVITAEDGTSMLTYTLTVDRQTSAGFAQDVYAKASNAGEFDQFGTSVALSGDTLAVGAFEEESNATGIDGDQTDNSTSGTGAVYIFRRDGQGTWSQEAYIKASNTEFEDRFGTSVALLGDTLAVGAPNESSSATGINGDQVNNLAFRSGAVYVFKRDSFDVWSQEAYIKASNTEAKDDFGRSVALFNDTLAVRADSEDSNATGVDGDQTDNSASASGAVYVFKRDIFDVWSQEAYIKASNTESGDIFGRSVALTTDTLAVGASFEDSDAVGINGDQLNNLKGASGAVYVFRRDGFGAWSQEAYIKASNTGSIDLFGASVALSGDTLAVGANEETSNATGIDGDQTDNSANDTGAVYVFERDSLGTWSQKAYIKASNSSSGDRFGSAVALVGDTLAVGSKDEGSNATGIDGDQMNNLAGSSGAVYLFKRDITGTWSQETYIKSSNSEKFDEFGFSVALSGDTLVVGAPQEDSTAMGINGDQTDNLAPLSGAVYVFE
jgi:hypothetical protein